MTKLGRFNKSELTLTRFVDASRGRLVEIPSTVAWFFHPSARENKQRIKEYRGKHIGQRCFILANGPSLNKLDLTLLKDEITFGLNRIYLLFDNTPYRPSYFVCFNGLILEQSATEISSLAMPKFLNWTWRHLYNLSDPGLVFVKDKQALSLRDSFERNLEKPIVSGGTVTYVALQIAFYMGFQEVVLIGLDHNYDSKDATSKTEIRTSDIDHNHFHPNYFPKGSKWQTPDLLRSELAYATARKAFEADGRRILDATLDGKCQVFEKVEFSSLFD